MKRDELTKFLDAALNIAAFSEDVAEGFCDESSILDAFFNKACLKVDEA